MSIEVTSRHLFLAQCSVEHTDSAIVADAAISMWKAMYAALEPMFGHGGVAALFKRSLALGRNTYPVLTPFNEQITFPDAFALLHSLLAKQTAMDAAAIHYELVSIFYDVMTSLIGESLTQRLLHAVFEPSSNGDAVQDLLP